jgi:hypothetical protein
MQIVLTDIEVNSPHGLVWTSRSLREGATTAAYAIGINMRNLSFRRIGDGVKRRDQIHRPFAVSTTADW